MKKALDGVMGDLYCIGFMMLYSGKSTIWTIMKMREHKINAYCFNKKGWLKSVVSFRLLTDVALCIGSALFYVYTNKNVAYNSIFVPWMLNTDGTKHKQH